MKSDCPPSFRSQSKRKLSCSGAYKGRESLVLSRADLELAPQSISAKQEFCTEMSVLIFEIGFIIVAALDD